MGLWVESGEEPVDRTCSAPSPVPDTLLRALPACVYFALLGTRRGRDECAHFTDPATEARGGGASNPRHPAGEGRVRIQTAVSLSLKPGTCLQRHPQSVPSLRGKCTQAKSAYSQLPSPPGPNLRALFPYFPSNHCRA